MDIEVIETSKGRHFSISFDGWGIPVTSTCSVLHAPHSCVSEGIEIKREDKVIRYGNINWAGTHAAAPRFNFPNEPKEYLSRLEAKNFEVGDMITITPMAGKEVSRSFDYDYWGDMMVFGKTQPTLYPT